jgi:hypothetical protein
MGEVALPVELGRLARAGRLDQLEHLFRNGTNMDAADEDGRTCLHLAAAYGHKHIVEFLANASADLNATDLQGRSALVYATQQNHQHVIKYLQEVVERPPEERPRFSTAVKGQPGMKPSALGEFDASPMKYVDDNAPRAPEKLMPFSSSRDLGRVDTSRNLLAGLSSVPEHADAMFSPGASVSPSPAKLAAAKLLNGDGTLNGNGKQAGMNGDSGHAGMNGGGGMNGSNDRAWAEMPGGVREPTDDELFGI